MTFNAKIHQHPDAVFGKDTPANDDVLMQLVEKLKVSDVRAFTTDHQSKIATAIAAASRRLVEDYSELVKERDGLAELRVELNALRIEIEAREQAVTAREALLGLRPQPEPKKSFFNFWK